MYFTVAKGVAKHVESGCGFAGHLPMAKGTVRCSSSFQRAQLGSKPLANCHATEVQPFPSHATQIWESWVMPSHYFFSHSKCCNISDDSEYCHRPHNANAKTCRDFCHFVQWLGRRGDRPRECPLGSLTQKSWRWDVLHDAFDAKLERLQMVFCKSSAKVFTWMLWDIWWEQFRAWQKTMRKFWWCLGRCQDTIFVKRNMLQYKSRVDSMSHGGPRLVRWPPKPMSSSRWSASTRDSSLGGQSQLTQFKSKLEQIQLLGEEDQGKDSQAAFGVSTSAFGIRKPSKLTDILDTWNHSSHFLDWTITAFMAVAALPDQKLLMPLAMVDSEPALSCDLSRVLLRWPFQVL